MKHLKTALVCALVACAACGSEPSEESPPVTLEGAPTEVTMFAQGGFKAPLDAVASPDGKRVYFAALTDDALPAVFTATEGQAAAPLLAGAPLEHPVGLVLSCDGSTLYVSDDGDSSIFALSTVDGSATKLNSTGIDVPAGLGMSPDCSTLHVTGQIAGGVPALFTLPTGGGEAKVTHQGSPLKKPSGVHVDANFVSWVMDATIGANGSTVLFAVTKDGNATEVISGFHAGTPGGVSLVTGGGNLAAIPLLNDAGEGELLIVEIGTGVMVHIAAPEMVAPAGIRAARNAPVLAIADPGANAIFMAR